MQKHEIFVGVDVSKSKLDVCVMLRTNQEYLYHQVYENTPSGIKLLLKELSKRTKSVKSEWLFCMEHTGVYSMPLAYSLSKQQVKYTLVPAIVIQRSIGLKRGKSDKADAKDIARYAYLNYEGIKYCQLPEKALMQLKVLLSHRERLLKAKTMFLTASKETEMYLEPADTKQMLKDSQSLINVLDKKIKETDERIMVLIKSDESLSKAYSLATSVPGVGPQITCYLLVYTRCFTSFDNARQLACYAGVAPFEYSSGSSIRGKTRVSHLANKKLKSLLNMGALNAKKYDAELKLYYERKVADGKNPMLVLNAVRNKLLSRIFAAVKRESQYVPLMQFAA